ncbi:hypothetical protein [Flectobacillus sp. BAB-3569]|uniref:hypothetical protein n=1 Tax=Flectobacillus sp. BAB-3569 TaxID=1509483 RepID=UPI000BA41F87|nr:hypothetical protein [Flectobacillus sp. BAB-3569]PAC30307.1 hypothetical protein BWI92_12425 [Flectobacillus sp. BAB-3569]
MNKIILFLIALNLIGCQKEKQNPEQKIFDRILFVYHLKQTVEAETWKTFNAPQYDVPLVYFTDSSSYIANPTEKFLKTFKSELLMEDGKVKIYKTQKRVDDSPFHMETGMTLGDPTPEFNYHSPFMMCSSFEETVKTIPDVGSTDEWTTMIIHEYFHGFQYKHKPYMEYYEKEIVQIQPDSLSAFYKTVPWFKESIDLENRFLLEAISEKDNIKTAKILRDFWVKRKQRRQKFQKVFKFDIDKFEKCYETMEGTARYVEFSLYNHFTQRKPDESLLKSDSSFKSFAKFKNYNLQKDQWLYLSNKTTYFYATGFNMARLLDKLGIDYKSRLFKDGKITLEDILQEKQ